MPSGRTRPILFWLAVPAAISLLAAASVRLSAQQARPAQGPLLTEQVFRNIQVLKGIPIDTFFTGYRRTALESDELITAVRFPTGREVAFRKVGTRAAQAISKVVMAVSRSPARVAIGSVRELFGRLRHYRNRQKKNHGNPNPNQGVAQTTAAVARMIRRE